MSAIEVMRANVANLLEAICNNVDDDNLVHVGNDREDSGDPPNKVIDKLLVVAGNLLFMVAGVVEMS